jgi:hypothetical protein
LNRVPRALYSTPAVRAQPIPVVASGVARQRGHDHVERIGGITAVRTVRGAERPPAASGSCP